MVRASHAMAPQSPDPVLEVRLISRPPVIIQAEAEGLLPRLTQYSPTADSLDSNAQAWSAQVTQLRPPEPREVWQRPSPPPRPPCPKPTNRTKHKYFHSLIVSPIHLRELIVALGFASGPFRSYHVPPSNPREASHLY